MLCHSSSRVSENFQSNNQQMTILFQLQTIAGFSRHREARSDLVLCALTKIMTFKYFFLSNLKTIFTYEGY